MDNLQPTDTTNVNFKDAPRLILIPVQDAAKLIWKENPKLHDIESVMASIARHGWQELPKLDSQLENMLGTKGAFKAGNGRVEALAKMEAEGLQLPRGIGKHKESGAWVVPVLAGTDEASADLAASYAIDSNNLTLLGGDATIIDTIKLYNKNEYLRLLEKTVLSGAAPVSVEEEDYQAILDHATQAPSRTGYVFTQGSVELPTDLLQPNDYDPHTMSDSEFDSLVASIAEAGILNPLIVRPIDQGRYEIVDGMQRHRAARKLKLPRVPAISRKMDRNKAIALCIAINQVQGKMIESRLSEALNTLSGTEDNERLMASTGVSRERLKEATGKVPSYGVTFDADGVPQRELRDYQPGVDYNPLEDTVSLLFVFAKDDYQIVKSTLDSIDTNWSRAIIALVEDRIKDGKAD